MKLAHFFDRFSAKVTKASGSHWAFIFAFVLVLIWGVCGPLFQYSTAWQMVINTGTTIITFLMVFILQQSGSKEMKVIQIKLDEIIRSNAEARNELIQIEEMTDEEIEKLRKKA